jgi:hypothetical protein
MRFQSLREDFDEARSSLSRPRLLRRSAARSALDERALDFPLSRAARSRFEERDSLPDEAVSRPPRFEDFEEADFAAVFFDAAADFFAGAADFFEPFAAADCGLKMNMAETARAIREGNRNFRVIEPSSLKNKPKRPPTVP